MKIPFVFLDVREGLRLLPGPWVELSLNLQGGAAPNWASIAPWGASCEQPPPVPCPSLSSPFSPRVKKKNKPLNLKIHNSVGSCENIPSQRSPLLSERSLRSFFVGYPPFLPSTPPVHTDATFSASKSRHGTAGRHTGVPCRTCRLEAVSLGRCKSTARDAETCKRIYGTAAGAGARLLGGGKSVSSPHAGWVSDAALHCWRVFL